MKNLVALAVLLFAQFYLLSSFEVGPPAPEQNDVPSYSAVDAYFKSLVLSRAKQQENAVRPHSIPVGFCDACSKKEPCSNDNLFCHKRRCVLVKSDHKNCNEGGSSGQLPGACEKCSKKKGCTNTNLICHKRRCVSEKADRKKCKKRNGGGGGGSGNGGEPGQCDKCSKKKGCSNSNLFCHKKFCVSKKKQWRKCKKANGGSGGSGSGEETGQCDKCSKKKGCSNSNLFCHKKFCVSKKKQWKKCKKANGGGSGGSGGEPGQCDKCSKRKGCSNSNLFCHKKFCVSKKKQWRKCKKANGGGGGSGSGGEPGQCDKCSKKKRCSNSNLFCHKRFCVSKKKQWRKCKKASGNGNNSGSDDGQTPIAKSEWCGPCAAGLLKCVAPLTCVLNHCILLTPAAEKKPERAGLLQCAGGGHCTDCGDGKPPCARGYWCSKNRCVRMGFDLKSCKKKKSKLCEPCGLGRGCIKKACRKRGKRRCRRVKCLSGFCVVGAKQVKKCQRKIRLSHRRALSGKVGLDTYASSQDGENVLDQNDDDEDDVDEVESDLVETIHEGEQGLRGAFNEDDQLEEMSRFEDDDFASEDSEEDE